MTMTYNFKKAEKKWTEKWQQEGTYKVNLKKPGKKFYNLMMFPYPSAEGLHVGNMYAFTGADFYGRFQAMQGSEVFEPIGLDGFGIHSENYAIKIGKHPAEQAKVSQKNFYRQLSRIGNRFAWEQSLETYDPDYYKWTQWLFIQMFEQGLAYRKKAKVNWCPSCKTVLADEQVENGKCERCGTETGRKETEQWFFKITDYADKLLAGLAKIDWPKKITTAQRNWIGRKEGINITYKISGSKKTVACFTTTPVNFGATFIVIAPEHELIESIKDDKVKKYVAAAVKKTEQQRQIEGKEKTGVFSGLYAINHVTKKEIPIWVADFVLKDIGTGAVQGCPGHDLRDFEFARKYKLPIPRVVAGPDGDESEIKSKKQVIVSGMPGKMVNSNFLNGIDFAKAMQKTMDYFEEKGWGKRVVSYHLRDWLISRQRYWGPPIPMMHCDKCGWVAEKLTNLPVLLPQIKDYQPTGDGKSPLEKASKDWLYTKCTNCGGKAKRETDVSDTFLDSSWYFLRYPSVDFKEGPFDPEVTAGWLPVDAYIGGAEHAVLHLLYSRFVWMALQDFGLLEKSLGPEPFPFLYSHGLLIKDGNKMSKSRGNVVNPDEYLDDYGADALRMYLMFLGPYNQGGDFKDTGIRGMSKFLDRVWRLTTEFRQLGFVGEKDSALLLTKLHQTIKKVTEDMKSLSYNTAIAALMELTNLMYELKPRMKVIAKGKVRCAEWEEVLSSLALMLGPMAPFMAEEMWFELGGKFSLHQQSWPSFAEELIKSNTVTLVVQVNGKIRGEFDLSQADVSDKTKVLKLAYSQPRVKIQLKGKKVKKEIFVPGKLVNLVVD